MNIIEEAKAAMRHDQRIIIAIFSILAIFSIVRAAAERLEKIAAHGLSGDPPFFLATMISSLTPRAPRMEMKARLP